MFQVAIDSQQRPECPLRICLVGDFSGNPDEGMKKVSLELSRRLIMHHEVLLVGPRKILSRGLWRRVRVFSPDILHYAHGPTIRSLVSLRFAKCLCGNKPKTVVSATRPYFSRLSRLLVPFVKPDLVLTQSLRFERFFETCGCNVSFLPNGVDVEKFRPVLGDEKLRLRRKYDVPPDKFTILHVGHIKANRNLEILERIPSHDEDVQVIVVGGTSMPMDVKVKDSLERAGCTVWTQYFEDIEEIYQMADCFVFPTRDLVGDQLPTEYNEIGSIDLPLSVLEAMACNLPVLSTRFGALPRLFEPGDGFFYFHNERDLWTQLNEIRQGIVTPKTRDQALELAWHKIIASLEDKYRAIVS